MPKITIAALADTHTGGYTALHPNVRKVNGKWTALEEIGGWNYRHNNHYILNSKQLRIWEHLENCLDKTLELRKNNKLVLLLAGDAEDGFHHASNEFATANKMEQCDTHIELMQYIQDRLAWQAGDQLYYVTGTDVHVGDDEHHIGKQLNSYQYSDGFYSSPFLEMNINGVCIWVYHQGVSAGKHPNRGNAQINIMKQIYLTCKISGKKIPRLILSGHTHDSNHATYTPEDGITMNYVILPSWQDKTRYTQDKMALSINKVGMRVIDIEESGEMKIHDAMLLESPRGESVTI